MRSNKSFQASLLFSPIHLIPCYSKDDSKLLNFPVVGKPFAITTSMILVIIRMKVLSEKRKELSQTIASLIGFIRTEKGCRRCDFFQSMEDENDLCLLEEWDTRENLNSHLKSREFQGTSRGDEPSPRAL